MVDDTRRAPSGQALVNDAPARHRPAGFDPSRCMDCGRANPVWFAPHDIWNRVIGGPDAKDDPGGFFCPSCFIGRAEETGLEHVWEVCPKC